MRYHIIRKYRIDIFIAISLLFHFLFAYMSGYLHFPSSSLPKNEPVKVTFLEEKKKPEHRGRIMETPKPLQEEKPLDQQILSEHDSRMHSNVGEKADAYRDHETVIPKSIPTPPAAPAPAIQKAPPPPKKVEEKPVEKKPEPVPEAKAGLKKMAAMEKEKKEISPSESLVRKKYDPNQKDAKSTADSPQTMEKSSPMESPLLDGTDLGKYARLDTGADKAEGPAADSDTISLDTQEFKYVSYFAQIKRKIELVWSYPPEAGRNGLFGRLLLKFTIRKDGSLENLQLMDSTGHQILDEEALRAVRMASPYPPFPKRIDKDKLNIIASFSYYPSFGLVE